MFGLKRMMLGILLILLGIALMQVLGVLGIPLVLVGAFLGFLGYYLWDD